MPTPDDIFVSPKDHYKSTLVLGGLWWPHLAWECSYLTPWGLFLLLKDHSRDGSWKLGHKQRDPDSSVLHSHSMAT